MPSERPAPAEAPLNPGDARAHANGERASTTIPPPPNRQSEPKFEPDAEPKPESEPPSPPPSEPAAGAKEAKRKRFESRLPSLIRRGIEKSIEAGLYTLGKSIETGRETTDAVRGVINEVKIPDIASAVGKALHEAKLPRELAGLVFSQLDETKNDVVRIIAREVRDFLDATDLASEIKAALTSLSFEIRTEVRFIPNDAGTGVRPDVRSRGRVKRRAARERRRSRHDAAERLQDEDDEPDDET